MEKKEYNQLIDECNEGIKVGDIKSMKYLGDLYYQGLSGNDENILKAFPYWKMAADYGDNDMALKVGLCLMEGNGCEKGEVEGFSYLLKSAKAGNAEAQFYVGLCYIDGYGVYKDLSYGKQFLRMAALQNHAQAQMDLARILLKGTEYSLLDGIHWLCCAHLNGIVDATNSLKIVMSDPGIAEFVQERMEYIRKYGVEPPKNTEDLTTTTTSNNEGCYIATAVYGSYEASEVIILRKFRDELLQKHMLGRIFIKIYYCLSPPIAVKLKEAKKINRLVRSILDRLIAFLQEKEF